ncbi:MAG: cell division protein ZapA [Clostridiales bacterium]|nr:cell division protein ZapA [Clostridiales bacterium]
MDQKNYTEVFIDGAVYTLGGAEDERYLQKVAAYLNDKIAQVKQVAGFSRLSADYQTLLVELNLADDYFKEQEKASLFAEQKAVLEKDAYSLKHELITTQMKLEKLQEELERIQGELRKLQDAGPSKALLQESELQPISQDSVSDDESVTEPQAEPRLESRSETRSEQQLELQIESEKAVPAPDTESPESNRGRSRNRRTRNTGR